MLEIILTTVVIFLFFMITCFYICVQFKILQYFLVIFQFIVCFILFSKNFYKKHILWRNEEYTYNKKLPFIPIGDIAAVYRDDHITFSHFYISEYSNQGFSLEKTEYNYECLENYFVNSSICPITDIIIEDQQVFHENYTEIKINDNKYIYFTNKKKNGRLYIFRNNNYESPQFDSTFNYESAIKIKKLEDDKLLNPLIELKNYIKFSDYICLTLLIFYLIQSFIEPCQNCKFNYFKILNILIQIVILVLYLFRYLKFMKVKKFFFDNEYFYKNKNEENVKDGYYYPNKVFNIDSFPLAISINILFINFLYIIVPDKCHSQKTIIKDEECNSIHCFWCGFIFFMTPTCLIFYIVCSALNAKNETDTLKKYDDLIYNWRTNPMQSIQINFEKSYELGRVKTKKNDYRFYLWRNNYFKVEKLKNYNYLNIYDKENGKLCGKDSFGNNLYFPEDIECPINDLFVKEGKEDFQGYERINLYESYYLYYTNKNINGTIIIDLKASSAISYQINKDKNEYEFYHPFELNLEESDQICTYLEIYLKDTFSEECKNYFHFYVSPFYEYIDSWDYISFLSNSIKHSDIKSLQYDSIKLYKIFYKGINTTKISNKKLIKNFENCMIIFRIIYIFKIIFFCLIAILYIPYICISVKVIDRLDFNEIYLNIFSIICITLIIIYIIFSIINIIIYIKYISNFMDMIDIYFEKSKISYLRFVATNIYLSIVLLNLLIFLLFKNFIKDCLENESDGGKKKYQSQKEVISVYNNAKNINTIENDKKNKNNVISSNTKALLQNNQIKINEIDKNNYLRNKNEHNNYWENKDKGINKFQNNSGKININKKENDNFCNINKIKNNLIKDNKNLLLQNNQMKIKINDKNNNIIYNKEDNKYNNNSQNINQNNINKYKNNILNDIEVDNAIFFNKNINIDNYYKKNNSININKDNEVVNNIINIKDINNKDNKNIINKDIINNEIIIKDIINQKDININKENNNIINNNLIDDKQSSKYNIIKLDEDQQKSVDSISSFIKHKPLCIICENDPTKIIFVPCGHRCLCHNCYEKQKDKIKECPLCRKVIETILNDVYDV